MVAKKRGLGRGLESLLRPSEKLDSKPLVKQETKTSNQIGVTATKNLDGDKVVAVDGSLQQVAVELMKPGAYQPRVDMHATALEELSDSIKAQGVIQPVIIRRLSDKDCKDGIRYEIIAGERRWRASQMAGLNNIPAIIRDVNDKETIAMALIENIQREDLNPIEEANSIKRLINEFNMTHQSAAEAVGRSRASVSNLLRLLDLEKETRTLLENGDLEMGHARALLALGDELQFNAAQQVIAQDLSVRETEKLVKRLLNPKVIEDVKIDPDIESLQEQLSNKLCTNVKFKHNKKGKGNLLISYNNLDELDGILSHIK